MGFEAACCCIPGVKPKINIVDILKPADEVEAQQIEQGIVVAKKETLYIFICFCCNTCITHCMHVPYNSQQVNLVFVF
jgi:hypothetical protein